MEIIADFKDNLPPPSYIRKSREEGKKTKPVDAQRSHTCHFLHMTSVCYQMVETNNCHSLSTIFLQ